MNLLSKKDTSKKKKVWHLYASTFLVIITLLALTLNVQLTKGVEALILSESSLTNKQVIFAERGLIYDRNGQQLVENVDGYDLFLNLPNWSKLTQEEQSKTLTLLESLGVDLNTLKPKIQSGIASKFAEVVIGKSIDIETANRLQLSSYAAISAKTLKLRRYLYGPVYGHILGYTGLPDTDAVVSGANPNSQVGKYRLEEKYDKLLRGVDGYALRGETYQLTPPVNGGSIKTTIDHNWQIALYNLLGRQTDRTQALAGAGMVLDSQTGEVMAYVSYPSYDPNALSYKLDTKQYGNWLNDARTPLLDKVIGIQSPTGSTFKIFSSFTLLANSVINEQTRLRSTGCISLGNGRFCEFGRRALGVLDITTALAKSSNIFFCTNLMSQENNLGIQRIVDDLAQFGFGSKTNIGFSGELSGVLPSPEYKQTTFKQPWVGGDTCNMSIGQGMFVATTAQMAVATNAFIGDGNIFQPQIIKSTLDSQGSLTEEKSTLIRKISMDSKTKSLILDGMYKVAHMPGGTAYAYLNKTPGNIRVKTGSAEAKDALGRNRVHSWSVGSFDYAGKNYTFALQLYFGGGGVYLNPVVRDFVNCVHNNFSGGCK